MLVGQEAFSSNSILTEPEMKTTILTPVFLLCSAFLGLNISQAAMGENSFPLREKDRNAACQERVLNPIMVMHYDFSSDGVFEVYSAPGNLTDIVLEAGENVLDVAMAGNEANWELRRVSGTSGLMVQEHFFVKALNHGCKAALMIKTDRRIYHINLCCSKDAWMDMVQWNYPGAEQLQNLATE